jgi:RNA:NAD 2'-phosphotransferase (TPT1/KptA family)
MDQEQVQLSRTMTYVLRHHPESFALKLDIAFYPGNDMVWLAETIASAFITFDR